MEWNTFTLQPSYTLLYAPVLGRTTHQIGSYEEAVSRKEGLPQLQATMQKLTSGYHLLQNFMNKALPVRNPAAVPLLDFKMMAPGHENCRFWTMNKCARCRIQQQAQSLMVQGHHDDHTTSDASVPYKLHTACNPAAPGP